MAFNFMKMAKEKMGKKSIGPSDDSKYKGKGKKKNKKKSLFSKKDDDEAND